MRSLRPSIPPAPPERRRTASSRPDVPLWRSPSLQSALPRCSASWPASGTRARVISPAPSIGGDRPPRDPTCRSCARRASRAHCRDCLRRAQSSGTARGGSFPPAPPEAGDRLLETPPCRSRAASVQSALPRLFLRRGPVERDRARVHSSSAGRKAGPPPRDPNVRSGARRASRAHCRDCSAAAQSSGTRARSIPQRRPIGGDRLLETRRCCFWRSPTSRAHCRIVLRRAQWSGTPRGSFVQRARKAADRLLETRAVSRSPSLESALPRLFCVMGQSSGTRARVVSSSAVR